MNEVVRQLWERDFGGIVGPITYDQYHLLECALYEAVCWNIDSEHHDYDMGAVITQFKDSLAARGMPIRLT